MAPSCWFGAKIRLSKLSSVTVSGEVCKHERLFLGGNDMYALSDLQDSE